MSLGQSQGKRAPSVQTICVNVVVRSYDRACSWNCMPEYKLIQKKKKKSQGKSKMYIETPQSVRVAWKNKAMKIRPTLDVPASTYI
jgi:hypothetical protein